MPRTAPAPPVFPCQPDPAGWESSVISCVRLLIGKTWLWPQGISEQLIPFSCPLEDDEPQQPAGHAQPPRLRWERPWSGSAAGWRWAPGELELVLAFGTARRSEGARVRAGIKTRGRGTRAADAVSPLANGTSSFGLAGETCLATGGVCSPGLVPAPGRAVGAQGCTRSCWGAARSRALPLLHGTLSPWRCCFAFPR